MTGQSELKSVLQRAARSSRWMANGARVCAGERDGTCSHADRYTPAEKEN